MDRGAGAGERVLRDRDDPAVSVTAARNVVQHDCGITPVFGVQFGAAPRSDDPDQIIDLQVTAQLRGLLSLPPR